jgi:formamidopyrimidine-DNA glycosylase
VLITNCSDEILYHAKIHPEQYSNTLNAAQTKQLHFSIHYVCSTSVDLLGLSEQFPEDWLFKHRWSKGKKNQPLTLPGGETVVFLTVGGRTSAVVPAVQKKTGPVAKELSDDDLNGDEKADDSRPRNKRKRSDAQGEDDDLSDGDESALEKKASKKKLNKNGKGVKVEKKSSPVAKRDSQKGRSKGSKAQKSVKESVAKDLSKEVSAGKRRSARIAK